MCLLRGTDWIFIYRQFSIQQFYVLPHSVFMCFVWIWEQTAIISLYSVNWLVFITETECVYCAVRTGFLNIIHINLSSKNKVVIVNLFPCISTTIVAIYTQSRRWHDCVRNKWKDSIQFCLNVLLIGCLNISSFGDRQSLFTDTNSCTRVLLEILQVTYLFKKCPILYGIQYFISHLPGISLYPEKCNI